MIKRYSGDKTKYLLANSLRALMKSKPFDKIKINDIVENCGMNRQTFYYHFQDMYALLEWLYYTDCILEIEKQYSDSGITDAASCLINYVDEHRDELANILSSKASDFFLDYVQKMLNDFVGVLIEDKRNGVRMTVDFRDFLSKFFTNAIIGMLTERVRNTPSHNLSVEENLTLFNCVFDGVLATALKNYAELSKM